MAVASVTNVFANDTVMESAKVNENFQDLVDFLDAEVIHADGAVAFTANIVGPFMPTTDDHLTKRAYVDANITNSGIPKTTVDAAGDLLVASADNTPARLAKGSDGDALKVVSGSVGWSPAPPAKPLIYGLNRITLALSDKWSPVSMGRIPHGGATQLVTGSIYYCGPFFVFGSVEIDNLGIYYHGDVGNSRMAIYQGHPTTGLPDTLLAETADTNTTTLTQTIPITPTTLVPGTWYWLGLQNSVTQNPAVETFNTTKGSLGTGWEDALYISQRTYTQAQAYGPFPATATPVRTGGAGYITWVMPV